MAHERCVETVLAVSGQFNRHFCTSLGEAHRVVGSWTWALWGPRECSGSSRLPPTTLAPPLPHLGGMGSPRGMLDPTPWCPSTAQKRLNGCFWGHHVARLVHSCHFERNVFLFPIFPPHGECATYSPTKFRFPKSVFQAFFKMFQKQFSQNSRSQRIGGSLSPP